MEDKKSTEKNIPIITKDVIKEHLEEVERSIKEDTFKNLSNDKMKNVLEENPDLTVEIIQPILESNKPEEYKKGYLAGIVTLLDLLKKQKRRSS